MRKKVLTLSVILILVSVAITSIISSNRNINNYINEKEDELFNYCRIINTAVERDLQDGRQPDYSRYAKTFSEETGQRVTFIRGDGEVLADSMAGSGYLSMGNHLKREEVEEALSTKMGISNRNSDTFHEGFLYVAVALHSDESTTVITRLAMEINRLEMASDFVIATALWSALAGIAVAMIIGILYALHLVKPIQTIVDCAGRIAEGNYRERIFLSTGDELENLGNSINNMADQLNFTIAALSDSNRRMSSVLFSMKEAIIAFDQDLRIIFVNQAAKELFGIEGNGEGDYLLKLIRNSSVHDAIKRVRSEDFVGEQEIEYGDGRILRMKTVLIQDQDKGEDGQDSALWAEEAKTAGSSQLTELGTDQTEAESGYMALIEDVTDLRRAERMRRDFVANVTHELKTPLTSISGFVETLQAGAAEDPITRRRFLDIISIEASRLKRLIEDILALSDIENRRELAADLPIDISEAIDRTIETIGPVIKAKGIQIERGGVSGIVIEGNPDRFRQMMMNLIENAVKYSLDGGTVKVSVEERPEWVTIRVEDHGIGIDSEHLSRIFERFYRVDPSRSKKVGGTGLGLAISKHIAGMFGGGIRVESEIGQGSAFTVEIPANRRIEQ